MRPDIIPQMRADSDVVPVTEERPRKADLSSPRLSRSERPTLSAAVLPNPRSNRNGANVHAVNGHSNGTFKAPLRSNGTNGYNGHATRRTSSGNRRIMALAPAEGSEAGVVVGGVTESWAEPGSAAATATFVRAARPDEGAARIAEWAAQIRPQTGTFYARHGKRLLDFVGALAGIVLLGPVMLLFALLIKVTSRGPVLYRSTRLGLDGRKFTFYKFRSMYVGADRDRDQLLHLNEVDGPVFKITRDPRTTQIGRFMRSTSIDELPQFFNVLRGDMSLVGPRPPLPEEEAKYEPWQRRRLEVKPGITCLWQISGRSRLGFNEWMRLDLEYIRRRSFRTDARILLRTVPAVLSRDGAY